MWQTGFELVWSWLVIHSTPPQKEQIAEAHRAYEKIKGFIWWLHVSYSILVNSLPGKGSNSSSWCLEDALNMKCRHKALKRQQGSGKRIQSVNGSHQHASIFIKNLNCTWKKWKLGSWTKEYHLSTWLQSQRVTEQKVQTNRASLETSLMTTLSYLLA